MLIRAYPDFSLKGKDDLLPLETKCQSVRNNWIGKLMNVLEAAFYPVRKVSS